MQLCVPQRVDLSSEVLLWKDHDRTGVDRQSQSVIQVHVIQPVVVHLRQGNRRFKR